MAYPEDPQEPDINCTSSGNVVEGSTQLNPVVIGDHDARDYALTQPEPFELLMNSSGPATSDSVCIDLTHTEPGEARSESAQPAGDDPPDVEMGEAAPFDISATFGTRISQDDAVQNDDVDQNHNADLSDDSRAPPNAAQALRNRTSQSAARPKSTLRSIRKRKENPRSSNLKEVTYADSRRGSRPTSPEFGVVRFPDEDFGEFAKRIKLSPKPRKKVSSERKGPAAPKTSRSSRQQALMDRLTENPSRNPVTGDETVVFDGNVLDFSVLNASHNWQYSSQAAQDNVQADVHRAIWNDSLRAHPGPYNRPEIRLPDWVDTISDADWERHDRGQVGAMVREALDDPNNFPDTTGRNLRYSVLPPQPSNALRAAPPPAHGGDARFMRGPGRERAWAMADRAIASRYEEEAERADELRGGRESGETHMGYPRTRAGEYQFRPKILPNMERTAYYPKAEPLYPFLDDTAEDEDEDVGMGLPSGPGPDPTAMAQAMTDTPRPGLGEEADARDGTENMSHEYLMSLVEGDGDSDGSYDRSVGDVEMGGELVSNPPQVWPYHEGPAFVLDEDDLYDP